MLSKAIAHDVITYKNQHKIHFCRLRNIHVQVYAILEQILQRSSRISVQMSAHHLVYNIVCESPQI